MGLITWLQRTLDDGVARGVKLAIAAGGVEGNPLDAITVSRANAFKGDALLGMTDLCTHGARIINGSARGVSRSEEHGQRQIVQGLKPQRGYGKGPARAINPIGRR